MSAVEKQESAASNMISLSFNEYPGRGLIVGQSDSGQDVVVYWLMGRSTSSRNRKLLVDEASGSVRTEAYDPSKIERPELLIYTAIREVVTNGRRGQIVSNGDQTDTVYEFLERGESFEEALKTRTYEPDAPNYTSRISGLLVPANGDNTSEINLSKVSRSKGGNDSTEGKPDHSLDKWPTEAGFGRMLHTYEGDGNPLPPFEGKPRLVLLNGNAEEIGYEYWRLLNTQNRVALVVKAIDRASSQVDWAVFNQFGNRQSRFFSLAA